MRITLVVILLLLSIALLLRLSGRLRHGDLLVLLLRLSTEETTAAAANEGVCATMQPYVTMPWAVEMNV